MKPYLRKFTSVLLLISEMNATAQAKEFSAAAKSWFISQTPSQAVRHELSKFPGLQEDYVTRLLSTVSSRNLGELEEATESVLKDSVCRQIIEVSFLDDLNVNDDANENLRREFESQVVHIQMTSCLPSVNADQVARAYMSAEFKAKGADKVVWSKTQGQRICQRTKVAMVGNSSYCYNEHEFRAPEGIYYHSFNDWNDDDADAPVYFREITTAIFDATVDGKPGTAFYTNIYVRGGKIPTFVRRIAKSSIAQSQQKFVELLLQMAAQQEP